MQDGGAMHDNAAPALFLLLRFVLRRRELRQKTPYLIPTARPNCIFQKAAIRLHRAHGRRRAADVGSFRPRPAWQISRQLAAVAGCKVRVGI
ncbi:MAG: hypothetical protein ACREDL_10520 [Bradyrhizobium sp.]